MSKTSNHFFNSKFSYRLHWRNSYRFRVGSLLPANKVQISEGLKYLSQESIRNRFMGSKKEFSEKELEYLTNLDGWNHYAIGIEEDGPEKRGVAIARLVRSSRDPEEAEIAITIIDEYQKIGLGSFLMKLIALAGVEREIKRFTFTFLPQNEAIVRLINKLGPSHYRGHPSMDYVELMVRVSDIDLDRLKNYLEMKAPGILTPPAEAADKT